MSARLAVALVLATLAAPRTSAAQAAPSAAPSATSATPTVKRGSPERTAGFVAAGLGLVGVGAGVYLAIDAASDAGTAAAEPALCGTAICSEAGLSVGEEVRSQRVVAAIFTGLGLAGLTAGALLIGFAPDPEPAPVAVAPAPMPGGAGVVIVGTF